jgi:hypothetical protein
MQDDTTFRMGEIVHLNSGSADLRIIAAKGEEIEVKWEVEPGIRHTLTFPIVCFYRS